MLKNQYQTNTSIFLELFKVYTFGIIVLLCLACLTILNWIELNWIFLITKYDTPKLIRGEKQFLKKNLFSRCLPWQAKDVGCKPYNYHMCTILTLNTKYLTILKWNIKWKWMLCHLQPNQSSKQHGGIENG
jgi:hypothetical protein